jgi:single-stranded DNA-binding protein
VNIRKAKNGNPYVTFALESWEGYPQRHTKQWHPCVGFNKIADIVHERFPDGTTIGVMGRLQSKKHEGEEGTKYETFVLVSQVTFNPAGFVANYDISGGG